MLSVEIKETKRANLYSEDRFGNAIVKCSSNVCDGLTVDREYEAFIPRDECFVVVTNDKLVTRSYSLEHFKVVKKLTIFHKFIDLVKYAKDMYD